MVRVAFIVWCSRIPNFQCDIFRLNYDDVIAENMDGRYSFPDLLGAWEKDRLVQINKTEVLFWNGSKISLEHCGNDRVMQKHQGIPKHARCFGEATQIGATRMRWLRAWMTVTEEMKDKMPEYIGDLYPNLNEEQLRDFFPKIIYATNPIGPSAGYFRRYFVKARPRYSLGYAPEEDGGFLRQYIPAKVEDNPSEDKEATRRRVMGLGDQATADALLNEDWDAPVGDFFRDYDDVRHTIPDFDPPKHWFKYRTFDWGSSDPFCVQWWAVSDGNDFYSRDGNQLWVPRGSLVLYREWYGCSPLDPSKGSGLGNPQIAQGILERTTETTSGLTLCDRLPFQERGVRKDGKQFKMCDEFQEHGVPLTLANVGRVYGCTQVRKRLQGKDGWPLIYFAQSCERTREYLPGVQQDPTNREAYVEDGEATHASDCVRYACATRPIVTDAPKNEENHMIPKRDANSPNELLRAIQASKRRGRRAR